MISFKRSMIYDIGVNPLFQIFILNIFSMIYVAPFFYTFITSFYFFNTGKPPTNEGLRLEKSASLVRNT